MSVSVLPTGSQNTGHQSRSLSGTNSKAPSDLEAQIEREGSAAVREVFMPLADRLIEKGKAEGKHEADSVDLKIAPPKCFSGVRGNAFPAVSRSRSMRKSSGWIRTGSSFLCERHLGATAKARRLRISWIQSFSLNAAPGESRPAHVSPPRFRASQRFLRRLCSTFHRSMIVWQATGSISLTARSHCACSS
jgi:hypothetical protein